MQNTRKTPTLSSNEVLDHDAVSDRHSSMRTPRVALLRSLTRGASSVQCSNKILDAFGKYLELCGIEECV